MNILPCRFNPLTGETVNIAGQPIEDCDDCGDCGTKSYEITSAIIVGDFNFRVTNIGVDFRLVWDCPVCGQETYDICTPIDAIPLSEEIRKDPLCFGCRTRKPKSYQHDETGRIVEKFSGEHPGKNWNEIKL